MDKSKFVVLNGDSLEVLKTMDDNSVNCCITSPPYYGLRDYGTGKWVGGDPNCNHFRDNKITVNCMNKDEKKAQECGQGVADAIYKSVCKKCGAIRVDKQIGLEETPKEYIDRLVDVFHEVKRVLTDDGVCFINIGDSYNTSATGNITSKKQLTNVGSFSDTYTKKIVNCCKPKDLIGIPWMLAFALRDDGWYLRQDIIWSKPNPMPEAVMDRFTKSHEYIFMLTKSERYYFNHAASLEPANYDGRSSIIHKGCVKYSDEDIASNNTSNFRGHDRWKFYDMDSGEIANVSNGVAMRNKRDVWSIPIGEFRGKHFATYPVALVNQCVRSGCKANGVVLDPFSGSGTTGLCAVANGMSYIGIELNEEYVKLSEHRFDETFNRVVSVNSVNKPDSEFEKFSFDV